jgi:hypothetical protein
LLPTADACLKHAQCCVLQWWQEQHEEQHQEEQQPSPPPQQQQQQQQQRQAGKKRKEANKKKKERQQRRKEQAAKERKDAEKKKQQEEEKEKAAKERKEAEKKRRRQQQQEEAAKERETAKKKYQQRQDAKAENQAAAAGMRMLVRAPDLFPGVLEVPVKSGDTTAKVLGDIINRAKVSDNYHPDNLQLCVLTWNREMDLAQDVNQIRDVNFGLHKIVECTKKMSLVVTLLRRPAMMKKTNINATADKLKRIVSSGSHAVIDGVVQTLQLVRAGKYPVKQMSQKTTTKQNSRAKKETEAACNQK